MAGILAEVNTVICEENSPKQNCEENKPATICEFYLKGKCRFGEKCNNFHPENVKIESQPENKRNKKTKKKVNPEEEIYVAKKPPMKTARDVRNRIIWDRELPSEYFSIGYLDRFEGLLERPFSSFVWGDLCDAGLDDLAIPQHCIVYFKYKGTKVWDKSTRLDHVFGSAENTFKIHEKIAEIDAAIAKEMELLEDQSEDEDDSDDDDGIVITGCAGVHGVGMKVISDMRIAPLRASHFLCIKVKSEKVIEEAFRVQKSVYEEDYTLRGCIMPRELLHVTLCMVKCESIDAMKNMETMLDQLKSEIQNLVTKNEASSFAATTSNSRSQREITAKGLSTFGARVLYVNLDVPESFSKSVSLLQEKIRKMEEVTVTNNFEFVPHMTLIKVNRPTEKARRSKYMNSSLYDDFIDHTFGVINFDNIHFCAIDDDRGPDGFYQTSKIIRF